MGWLSRGDAREGQPVKPQAGASRKVTPCSEVETGGAIMVACVAEMSN